MTPQSEQFLAFFSSTRNQSLALCEGLETDDFNLQAIAETSPLKWHLAHTTWFFETFILKVFSPHYEPVHSKYEVLFNSYYNSVGEQFPRPKRHLLSRPSIQDVFSYREQIDQRIIALASSIPEQHQSEFLKRLLLGIHHEKQHQELMLTDLKFNWFQNPLYPVYNPSPLPSMQAVSALEFIPLEAGLHSIGLDPNDEIKVDQFSFDNEGPRHQVWINDCQIANRLITNGEYNEFIQDGGYQDPQWWTSDGWACVQAQRWQAPLYWLAEQNEPFYFTLHGFRPIDQHMPVCHVSLYEALAFANWKGARLCREEEWEVAAQKPVDGQLQTPSLSHPTGTHQNGTFQNLFGDVWEWTQSAYSPYPGYQAEAGALGEYNGKFMINQVVLRGGSVATPQQHIRPSYRNFFYPQDRWQFSGIRLAKDS